MILGERSWYLVSRVASRRLRVEVEGEGRKDFESSRVFLEIPESEP
jgi:hypothetical protein